MKTRVKLSLLAAALIAIIVASCKGKPGSSSLSGSDASTPSATAAAAKGNTVMDSLSITDPDEKKICGLYDDAVTDYLTNTKVLFGDTSKAADAQRKALDDKWKAKEAEIKPQVQDWQKRIAGNPAEAMKFAQFSIYESKRLMGVMAQYQKNLMKNIPGAPAGN
jgi:hypothetical protein